MANVERNNTLRCKLRSTSITQQCDSCLLPLPGPNLFTPVAFSVSTKTLEHSRIITVPFVFSAGSTAFNSWSYILTYRSSSATNSSTLSLNTTLTSLHLESLQPATLYQLTITARGPGGEESPASKYNFTTKSSLVILPLPAQCEYKALTS